MANIRGFDIQKEFFVIDSYNISEVRTRLYGFALVDSFPVCSAEELNDRMPTGEGAYVYVRRSEGKIIINQDYIGSYGLYLYRDGAYYALSNSFCRLVDHVKTKHPITLNKDYATAFIPVGLCAISFSETMIREIRLLDRSAVVEIDVDSGSMTLSCVDYGENTLEISSREGIAVLDSWYKKWTSMIRNLVLTSDELRVDLTGGFDSRLTFGLVLGSGIEMSKVFVNSIKDELHTHKEDYEIASSIAAHYNFLLNDRSSLVNNHRFYTYKEVLDISYYLKLGFHKQMYYRSHCFEKPSHCFGGGGGECVRDYWNVGMNEYIDSAVRRCRSVFGMGVSVYTDAVRRVLEKAFHELQEKFSRLGRPIVEEDLSLSLYRETRCRNHFGKAVVEDMYGNVYRYTPLLDPQLHKLKLSDTHCKDKNLLMTVIFARYNPDLLTFKFEGGRFIAPSTIEYAQDICRKYPYSPGNESSTGFCRTIRPAVSIPPLENPRTSMKQVNDLVKQSFNSRRIRNLFCMEYELEIYNRIREDVVNRTFFPLQGAHTVLAICKSIKDCATSDDLQSDSISAYLAKDLTPCSPREMTLRGHPTLDQYITARVDIVCESKVSNEVGILNLSDSSAKVNRPKWLDPNGMGFVIESFRGSLELDIICKNEGCLKLRFRGRDVRDHSNRRIPVWIDLTSVVVDEISYLTNRHPIWHDVPFSLNLPVTPNQVVHLCVQWAPHNEAHFISKDK